MPLVLLSYTQPTRAPTKHGSIADCTTTTTTTPTPAFFFSFFFLIVPQPDCSTTCRRKEKAIITRRANQKLSRNWDAYLLCRAAYFKSDPGKRQLALHAEREYAKEVTLLTALASLDRNFKAAEHVEAADAMVQLQQHAADMQSKGGSADQEAEDG